MWVGAFSLRLVFLFTLINYVSIKYRVYMITLKDKEASTAKSKAWSKVERKQLIFYVSSTALPL